MNKLSNLKKIHLEDCMIDDEGMTLFEIASFTMLCSAIFILVIQFFLLLR